MCLGQMEKDSGGRGEQRLVTKELNRDYSKEPWLFTKVRSHWRVYHRGVTQSDTHFEIALVVALRTAITTSR